MAAAPVAVIVPTHDHPNLLPFAVASLQAQTYVDTDIVIVGDGVADETRDVVRMLMRDDSRIRFVDKPKTGRTGEPSRHEVLSELRSPVVAYHGDDDLAFPDHLEVLLKLLRGNDFAHPRPVLVYPDGALFQGPFDASKWWWRRSIYPPMNRNMISLTGVVHTLEAYRRLPHGWRSTPPGIATDHYMWQQFFELPGLRAVTGKRATTVKLASHKRQGVAAAARLEETQRWWAQMADPGFQSRWDASVTDDRRGRTRVRAAAIAGLALTARSTGPPWWLRTHASLRRRVLPP